MGFKCQECNAVVEPIKHFNKEGTLMSIDRQPQHTKIVSTRSKSYESYDPETKKTTFSQGSEIVREMKVCSQCICDDAKDCVNV